MTSFGRSARQNVIWDEFQAIRDIGGDALLDPEAGEYENNGLQDEWDALVTEYNEIHTANETKG